MKQRCPFKDAVKYHVGGIDNYYIVGEQERAILEYFGLKSGMALIDLGCGGGRLAQALRTSVDIDYLGIDVVDSALIIFQAIALSPIPISALSAVVDCGSGKTLPDGKTISGIPGIWTVGMHYDKSALLV